MDFDWDSESDSDAEYEDLFNIVIMRRSKVIRESPHHFQMYDEKDFRNRFRMNKQSAWNVLCLIKCAIQHKTDRNNALCPEQMLLLTLRFYATGSMLLTVGDLFRVSKSTASRVITNVSHNIAKLREKFIEFPKTTEEIKVCQKDFFKLAKFPRVIAAIDCTHVKVLSPGGEDSELFRNRKGFFSINVQTLCDSHLKILDIVARWPGSTHDSTIFRNSRIKFRLESGEFGSGLVVADSGYENNNKIITPLLKINSPAENLFNESLIRTRNCVERSYGVWKRRFPVLSLGLRLHIRKAQSIIIATAVLHNICCDNNDKSPAQLSNELETIVADVLSVPRNHSAHGNSTNNFTRKSLVDNYFANF